MKLDKINALVVGFNSSIPLILELFCNKVILAADFSKRKPFKEQEHFDRISSQTNPSHFFGFLKRARELRSWVKQNDINLIFINRKDDMLALRFAFLFRKKRPLFLGTFHDSRSWKNDKKVKKFVIILKHCLDGVLAMASFVYKKMLDFDFPKDRLIFFPNFIKYDDFVQKIDYTFDDYFKMCFSGTIDDRKNELFIIQVVNKLKQKYKLKLDIYGYVLEEEYKKTLDSFISENDLSNNVEFCGPKTLAEEKQLLLQHDLYFSASKEEMSPLNILNAKACAMPILVSNTNGQQDLINDGVDGVKYEPDNLEDAVNKLEYLIKNISFREYIGKNAYESVSCSNSYQHAAKKLESFIRNLYEKKNCNY